MTDATQLAEKLEAWAANMAVGADPRWEPEGCMILRQAAALLRSQAVTVEYVCGCFDAAHVEGWIEALAEGDLERIRDIAHRRLAFAYEYALNARTALNAANEQQSTIEET